MLIRIMGSSGGVDADFYNHWVNPEQIAYTKPVNADEGLWVVRLSGVEERHQTIIISAREHKNLLKLVNNK